MRQADRSSCHRGKPQHTPTPVAGPHLPALDTRGVSRHDQSSMKCTSVYQNAQKCAFPVSQPAVSLAGEWHGACSYPAYDAHTAAGVRTEPEGGL